MLKKINKLFWMTILFSVLLLVVGVLFVAFPNVSINALSILIASSLLAFGLILVLDYKSRIFYMQFVTLGVIFIILGATLLLHTDIVQSLVPIIIGAYIIVNEIINMQISLKLMKYSNKLVWAFILSLLSCICGCFMIIYPTNGALAITLYMGIVLIIYSVSVLTNMIIFKKHINDIVKIAQN